MYATLPLSWKDREAVKQPHMHIQKKKFENIIDHIHIELLTLNPECEVCIHELGVGTSE